MIIKTAEDKPNARNELEESRADSRIPDGLTRKIQKGRNNISAGAANGRA